MGKTKLIRVVLIAMIFASSLLFSGCQTCAGFGEVGKGIAKDSAAAWGGISGLDDWIRKNMW